MIPALLAGAAALLAPPGEVDRFPKAAASYLVAVDGRVLWSRAADTPRPPASLTKIMSALVLLDGDFDPEVPVVVSARAASATGSRAGLRAGESLAALDLLTAMLVS
jgi:D-alanyl-D-alanine carboxypeptidase (penicillin-binding protein 5/6)